MTYPAPVVPAFTAGDAPDVLDFTSLIVDTLGFCAASVIFRGEQRSSQSTGAGSTISQLLLDTVLEDPYGGWDPSAMEWTAPYDAWYEITVGASVGATAGNPYIAAAAIISGTRYELDSPQTFSGNSGGAVGSVIAWMTGGADTLQAAILSTITTSTDTSNPGRYPFLEVSFAST